MRGYAASADASAGFAVCSVYTNRKNRRVRRFSRNMKLLINAAHRQEEANAFLPAFPFQNLRISHRRRGTRNCAGNAINAVYSCLSRCGIHEDAHVRRPAGARPFRDELPQVAVFLQQVQSREQFLRFLKELAPASLEQLRTFDL